MAGLNYFLTDHARGGESKRLLGEKKDVRVWLSWLERLVHKEVEVIHTPIGYLPVYEDLRKLFKDIINKDYEKSLYTKQFSLYVDKIIARLQLQLESYSNEEDIPARLFEILTGQKERILDLKKTFGPIVTPQQLLNHKL